MTEEALIKRLRRQAKREGVVLRRSRIDGTWMIIDATQNMMVAGPRNSDGSGGLALEEVEAWLAQPAN